jgi:stage V sporulation protein AF
MIIVDNSPEVIILPTTLFDFVQETNDFYFPPLTGGYLRIIRQIIMWLTLFMTPAWYLVVKNPDIVPSWLAFTIPTEYGKIPIIAQLFLVEFVIDGLRMASMNTPDMLSNSLSVVGALILGDFAVGIGWFSEDVIFYMACVAIANFAQQNHELGYAFKFMRLIILTLVYFFGVYGFIIGLVFFFITALMNSTVANLRGYLYPLIPFSAKAILRHLFRFKKNDVEN